MGFAQDFGMGFMQASNKRTDELNYQKGEEQLLRTREEMAAKAAKKKAQAAASEKYQGAYLGVQFGDAMTPAMQHMVDSTMSIKDAAARAKASVNTVFNLGRALYKNGGDSEANTRIMNELLAQKDIAVTLQTDKQGGPDTGALLNMYTLASQDKSAGAQWVHSRAMESAYTTLKAVDGTQWRQGKDGKLIGVTKTGDDVHLTDENVGTYITNSGNARGARGEYHKASAEGVVFNKSRPHLDKAGLKLSRSAVNQETRVISHMGKLGTFLNNTYDTLQGVAETGNFDIIPDGMIGTFYRGIVGLGTDAAAVVQRATATFGDDTGLGQESDYGSMGEGFKKGLHKLLREQGEMSELDTLKFSASLSLVHMLALGEGRALSDRDVKLVQRMLNFKDPRKLLEVASSYSADAYMNRYKESTLQNMSKKQANNFLQAFEGNRATIRRHFAKMASNDMGVPHVEETSGKLSHTPWGQSVEKGGVANSVGYPEATTSITAQEEADSYE
jgi:hypothetical protein